MNSSYIMANDCLNYLNEKKVTKFLREFDVEDKNPETLTDTFKNLTVVHKYVTDLNSHNHVNNKYWVFVLKNNSKFLYLENNMWWWHRIYLW